MLFHDTPLYPSLLCLLWPLCLLAHVGPIIRSWQEGWQTSILGKGRRVCLLLMSSVKSCCQPVQSANDEQMAAAVIGCRLLERLYCGQGLLAVASLAVRVLLHGKSPPLSSKAAEGQGKDNFFPASAFKFSPYQLCPMHTPQVSMLGMVTSMAARCPHPFSVWSVQLESPISAPVVFWQSSS